VILPPSLLVPAGIGLFVLFSNPRRFQNQVLAILSAIASVWVFLIYRGGIPASGGDIESLAAFPWRRANAAVAALCPWILSILRKSVITPPGKEIDTMRRSWPWLIVSAALIILCYQRTFIFENIKSGNPERGAAYLLYNIVACSSYFLLSVQAWNQMIVHKGIHRFETLFLVLIPSTLWLYGAVTTSIGNFFEISLLKKSMLYFISGTLFLASWAATTKHLFHPREVFLSIIQRVMLACIVFLAFFCLWRYYIIIRPWILDIFLCIALFCSFSIWIDRESRTQLNLHGERSLTKIRREVTAVAAIESRPDTITLRFVSLLCQRWQTSTASFLFEGQNEFGSLVKMLNGRGAGGLIGDAGWATPESLERGRRTQTSDDLYRYLVDRQIGLLVASPRGSETPSLLIALGQKTTLWPFTYLEIRDLQNIAELMGDILTRSRLAAQAALNARVEHLAMMSRGLAHDLKNLITPVSSFLVHTDGHFARETPAGEVHSVARRSVKIMTEYVREALFFSEQLTPRFEPVDFAQLFSTVAEITATRASNRHVLVTFGSAPYPPLVADAVLLQRVLANLVNNAIDASRPGQQVTVSTATLGSTKVRLQVEDHGCGIPSENLARIFDPYFTTKEFGDDIRGFGLGLTICQKIIQLHGGVVSVESAVQRGTTVSMVLPHNPGSENESAS
jgi:signal transduction histidine kinase